MFTFEEFKVDLVKRITDYLGEDGEVEIITNTKNNGTSKEAILMKGKDNKISPCIYVEAMYEDYENGAAFDDIMDIIKMVFEQKNEVYDELFFKDWNNVRPLVTVAVVNTEWNKEILEYTCHKEILNLSIICKCIVQEDEKKRASFNIMKSHLKEWEISEDELWEAAVGNLNKEEFHTRNLSEMLSMLDGMERNQNDCLYVISNEYCKDGAKVILRPTYFEILANALGSDLYVLPSSTHEVICISVDEHSSVDEINNMIKEINSTQVEKEDRLSDIAYRYSRETGEITIA